MKHHLLILFPVFLIVSLPFASCKRAALENEVTVYAYDSFTAEWGAGPKIASLFEAETGCKVNLVTCEDGGAVLSKAVAEKSRPKADVLIGIDNQLLPAAKKFGVLEPYTAQGAQRLSPGADSAFGGEGLLTPFDYGYFAFMYNTESGIEAPSSLEDLTSERFAKRIVIMDPRTSTPGLGLFSWIESAYGERALDWWARIKPNILTMSPGWSAGYALFTSGEAPLVVSYTTSIAAHRLYDKTEKFQPLIFPEGHILQTEGMGLVKNAPHPANAKQFIDLMLTDKAQSLLPETQFMFPAVKDAPLPDSFRSIPEPPVILTAAPEKTAQGIDDAIRVLSE
ncbi:MAG: thiamine ABC transporter substrate-binding protein [Treponema sp.]